MAKKKTGAPARAAKTTKSARAARPARAAKGTKAAKPARGKKGGKKAEALLLGAPTPMIRIFGAAAMFPPPPPPAPPPPPPPLMPTPVLNIMAGNQIMLKAVFRSGGNNPGATILNTADLLGGSSNPDSVAAAGNVLTVQHTFMAAGTFTLHTILSDPIFGNVVASDALIVTVN